MPYILLVDDDPIFCGLLVLHIRECLPALSMFPIVTAGDGEQCLEYINRQMPLFLILNIWMPRKNGYEVLQELSTRDERFPILVLSAFAPSKKDVSRKGSISEDRFGFSKKPCLNFSEVAKEMLSRYSLG